MTKTSTPRHNQPSAGETTVAMTAGTAVSVKIDTEAGAAYLRLGRGQVARTVEFTEDVYVDLDQFGVVVGIELLDLDTPLPLDKLAARFHTNAGALDVLGCRNWATWARETEANS